MRPHCHQHLKQHPNQHLHQHPKPHAPSTSPSISQITLPTLLEVRTPIAFSYLGEKNNPKKTITLSQNEAKTEKKSGCDSWDCLIDWTLDPYQAGCLEKLELMVLVNLFLPCTWSRGWSVGPTESSSLTQLFSDPGKKREPLLWKTIFSGAKKRLGVLTRTLWSCCWAQHGLAPDTFPPRNQTRRRSRAPREHGRQRTSFYLFTGIRTPTKTICFAQKSKK